MPVGRLRPGGGGRRRGPAAGAAAFCGAGGPKAPGPRKPKQGRGLSGPPPPLCAPRAPAAPPGGLGRTANPWAALIHQGSHPNGLHPPEGRLLGVVGHNDQGPTLAVGPNIFHGPQAGIRIQAFKSLVQRQQRGIV